MSWGSSLTPFDYRHFTDLWLDSAEGHEELPLLFADVLVIVVEAQVLVIVVEERGADRGRHVVLPVLVQHHRAAVRIPVSEHVFDDAADHLETRDIAGLPGVVDPVRHARQVPGRASIVPRTDIMNPAPVSCSDSICLY